MKFSFEEIDVSDSCSESTPLLISAYLSAYALNVALAASSNALGYSMLQPTTNLTFSFDTAVYAGMIGAAIQQVFTHTQAAICSSEKYMAGIDRMNGTETTWWGICIKDRVDCLPSGNSLATQAYALIRPIALSVTASLIGGAVQGALTSTEDASGLIGISAAGAAVVNPLLFLGSKLITDIGCCPRNCFVPQITCAAPSSWVLSCFNRHKKEVLGLELKSVTPTSSKEQSAINPSKVIDLSMAMA